MDRPCGGSHTGDNDLDCYDVMPFFLFRTSLLPVGGGLLEEIVKGGHPPWDCHLLRYQLNGSNHEEEGGGLTPTPPMSEWRKERNTILRPPSSLLFPCSPAQ